jgi:NAD(P)-dependent dehydrogenase (short-subunit alcohol dehydrogenase family)
MHVWRSVVFDSAFFGKGADARVGDDQGFAISPCRGKGECCTMTEPAASPHPAIATARLAVVTGGASGIGFACAARFLSAGMRVCLVDRDEAALAKACAALGDDDRVLTRIVDVADRGEVEALSAELGPVAVLMNNAAIGGGGDVLADPAGWERLIAVNLMGVFHGVSAFLPAMLASAEPGLIINTGSKQGITQPPGNTAYNVAKSAVKALTEGLAHTVRQKTGTRVTAHLLIPGFTYTGMTRRNIPEQPSGAWTPDQVAQALFEGLGRGDFYILCPDNETTLDIDRKRMAWAMGDLIENRPALSRWHPDYKAAFDAFMAG